MPALDDFAVYLTQAHARGDENARALPVLRLALDKLRRARSEMPSQLREAGRAPASLVVAESAGTPARPGELAAALHAAGLPVAFCGRAPDAPDDLVAIVDPAAARSPANPPPDDFQVLAIVPAYNEADIIAQTLRYLIAQGLEVYLLDNWSTDGTVAQAQPFLGRGLVGIERFPRERPQPTYNLSDILMRVEALACEHYWADWIVLHDADERRRSPWPGATLREAFWRVDCSGFSCVDHVTLNFRPTDNSFDPERADVEEHFPYFEFSDHPGHFHQRRAWKRGDCPVALAVNAGHDVTFPGRRVYPYKFLLKHYPVRSQQHGVRKVTHERAARWNTQERACGWHRQYDGGSMQFVRDPHTLRRFDTRTFRQDHLVQALSGAGIFTKPPSWATPPKW